MAKDSKTTHTAKTAAPAPVRPVAPVVTHPVAPAPAVPQPAQGVKVPQVQADAVGQTSNTEVKTAGQDITSESNYNQARTPQEQRASAQAATNEAEEQKKAHPGGLPLPTSGQPLTRPNDDKSGDQ